jgi:AraC-like DNA-binding protein
MTPVDYINMVRIQRACELLKTSDNSMNDIAVKCGYDTPSTFNRNFRRLLGVSPYKWKRNPENYESSLLHFHISAEKGW